MKPFDRWLLWLSLGCMSGFALLLVHEDLLLFLAFLAGMCTAAALFRLLGKRPPKS